MKRTEIARLIDHTALKPDTSVVDIEMLCEEAVRYGFASVCVNPCYVPLSAELLATSPVVVCTVAGFPLGANRPGLKVREAEIAVSDGASEVDMVINVGMLKSGETDYVESDIRGVVDVLSGTAILKVILETALLTDAEKRTACKLALAAGADFVKTSTGFGSAGATREDVSLMREVVGDQMGVKAAGGIRTAKQARAMIGAGASRLGTSASVSIVEGWESEESVDVGSSGY